MLFSSDSGGLNCPSPSTESRTFKICPPGKAAAANLFAALSSKLAVVSDLESLGSRTASFPSLSAALSTPSTPADRAAEFGDVSRSNRAATESFESVGPGALPIEPTELAFEPVCCFVFGRGKEEVDGRKEGEGGRAGEKGGEGG